MSLHNRKANKNYNFLLNFKSYEKESQQQTRDYHARKSKSTVVPFSKERFLQANYRFIVSDTGDYSENLVDPDLPIDWDKVEQVHLRTHLEVACPICLDSPVVAKVSRCGHVFCFVCILRHLSYSPKNIGHCPICFETVRLKDLKSVVIDTVHHYNEGDAMEFTLLKRAKYSSICLPRSSWRAKTELHPSAQDEDTKFTRFAIIEDIAPIIDRVNRELQRVAWEAHSSQDDSIPFVSTAQLELEDRQNRALVERRLKMKDSQNDAIGFTEPVQQEEKKSPVEKISAWDLPVTETGSLTVTNDPNALKDWEHEMEELKNYLNNEKLASSPSPPKEPTINEPKHKQPKQERIADSEDFYYLYQSSDGQQIFLHPTDFQILVAHYGSHDKLPETISGKIIESEDLTQTENSVKRYRFLSHLPLTSQFHFVELDMRPLVSREAMHPFMDEIQKRIRRRNDRKKKEKEEKRREEEEAKNRFAKLNIEQDFPQYLQQAKDEIPEELLKQFAKEDSAAMQTTNQRDERSVLIDPSPPSHSQPIPINTKNNNNNNSNGKQHNNNNAWTNRGMTPPKQHGDSPTNKSFLEAAKANKLYIPSNLPVKNSKSKGKQVILFSTAGRRSFK